jgi:hypothetical protein
MVNKFIITIVNDAFMISLQAILFFYNYTGKIIALG